MAANAPSKMRLKPETAALPLEERIRQRAHEIWLNRGDRPGSAVEDWLQAEEEIQLTAKTE